MKTRNNGRFNIGGSMESAKRCFSDWLMRGCSLLVQPMGAYQRIGLPLILMALRHSALADVSAAPAGDIENFSCDSGQFRLRLPPDARALSQLGLILRQGTGEVQQWDGYQTTRKYVRYAGFDLGYIIFSNDPSRYIINYVEVTKSGWQITGPFKVGDSVDFIQRALGPGAQDDVELKRSYGGDGGSVSFEQVNGKITRIKYMCYTG